MDKAAIKKFAVWARRKLIEDVGQKAYEIGITEDSIEEAVTLSSDSGKVKGRTLDKKELNQRRSLISKIRDKGYEEVIEEVAYTWFNRFIALRFMEVNDYLPSGVRVLSSVESGKVEPDIIKNYKYVDLNLAVEDLKALRDMEDSNDTDNMYRFLLIKQCNKLNEILPGMFEKIEDYTELLLPDNLLSKDSVIRRFVSDIPEEDYKDQVEIIGWLYQYYISEKKNEVFEGLKKNIKITKENIPAATQLFTPDWIVKYMVENSLGRLWLEGHPDDELKSEWKYYLDEAEQEPDVQKQLDEIREQSKKIKPEDIKVLDPAMGSGHILVYAFDVLYEIYKKAGYSEKDIPKLILKNNLYGLEIDDRAAQLAYFSVMMKSRSKSRGIFNEQIDLNICSIQESNGIPEGAVDLLVNPKKTALEGWVDRKDVEYLINVFHDAKEYGSILDVKSVDFGAIEKRLEEIKDGDLPVYQLQMKNVILERIPPLIKQARIMSQKYDVVCTNPPYMSSGGLYYKTNNFLKRYYQDSCSDLYSTFIELCSNMTRRNRFVSMITQQSWMFLSSFKALRKKIIENMNIYNMIHLGPRAFKEIGGEVVQSTAFVLRKFRDDNFKGTFIRLVDNSRADEKELKFLNIINDRDKSNKYFSSNNSFKNIYGMPIAYWISNRMRIIFNKNKKISDFAECKSGIMTGNDKLFLKFWFEVCSCDIGLGLSSYKDMLKYNYKWYPLNKGGEFRKWYGNNDYIIFMRNSGQTIKQKSLNYRLRDSKYYFLPCITWSRISMDKIGFRKSFKGYLFGDAGPSIFIREDKINYLLGFLCSKIPNVLMKVLNPTFNFQVQDIESIPIIDSDNVLISDLSKKNINISKIDWDSYETSWDFKKHPILTYRQNVYTVKQAFNNWSAFAEKQFYKLKANEEELNRIFIDIYGLQDELTPEEEDRDVTIRKADRVRDIKSFISYAVGCMFGRYSIDADGLIYAGGEWNDKWKMEDGKCKVRKIVKDDNRNIAEDTWVGAAFVPDGDDVIPVTDEEYFSDDIVSRFVEFVKVAFREGTLEENLDYIAETIGRRPKETSRQSIRRYFLKDFYKDHVRMYKKRPIYWLFDSGKDDGFKALIYMHRYDEFTVSRVRTDYLHKLQRMYEAEYGRLDIVIESDASEREKAKARKRKEKLQKQMAECFKYDQVIAHVANQRIKIDLDDGVKVNYAKFQNIEVPQGEGRKTLKADLLAKI